eukprot:2143564-Karenia_brevis.AAC.1
MGKGSGVPAMPLKVPSEESSSDTHPRIYGEQMRRRGTRRDWAEDALMDDEEESSRSSSSSNSKKNEP